jgi:hypothetical protein
MLRHQTFQGSLVSLIDRLEQTPNLTSRLFDEVVASACAQQANTSPPTKRLEKFVAAEAWTDAALHLIEREAPAWSVRRLVLEDGEWICCLSRQPNLPLELDDCAEARHTALPLALLSAFLEARRLDTCARKAMARTVPQIRPETGYPVCCDNFA